ncbi:hypothetical protein [Microvirga aerophila]|uniref:Uncharacterized protein n=1 Tax=Microvirga aerophila TaxID=670291 RepID=A0A512BWS2_9HYPH|nr:hypothetical protein [Microvirga aerophila]GEO16307.1 hypothetical protein MAE02_40030 [Microvirga aerophila]
MPQPRAAPEGDATGDYACRDWIEQQIVRAYVRLALSNDADCSRTVTLARLSDLEVRLTEAPWIEQPDLPPFWLEINLLTTGSTIDSTGCFEFGEDELEAVVDLVCEAKDRHQAQN